MRDEKAGSLRVLGRLLAGHTPGPDVDWAAIVGLARLHGLSALLYWRLSEQGGAGEGETRRGGDGEEGCGGLVVVSPGELEALQRDFYAAAAQVMVAERQLAQVLAALATAGVPTLVVKGAAMGALYPDPALRTYGDLDVLVPATQLDEAEKTLSRLGYRHTGPKEWWLKQLQHLPPMMRSDGSLPVEVHWRLDEEGSLGHLPSGDLWARAVPWSVDGQAALRLEVIDAVLHLCRHAVVQHRADLALRPLCDLAYGVEGWGEAEWEALARRARVNDLGRPVYLMLSLAEQVLGLAVPEQAMAALRPPEPVPDNLVEQLLDRQSALATRVPMAVVRARAQATTWARVRHFLWHLFLPRDGMEAVYGVPADSPRIWLTYLWRPVDLLRRYGRSAWGALRGDPAARAAWDREAWLERWLRG
jgi:hypothetical protein